MKISHYISLTLFVCLLTTVTSFSQNIQTSTIEWSCSSTSQENTKVVSSPTEIIWYAANGVVKKTLAIVRVDGTWDDVTNDGAIMIHARANNNTATFYFSKSYGVILVSIKNIDSEESPTYDLNVTNVTAL